MENMIFFFIGFAFMGIVALVVTRFLLKNQDILINNLESNTKMSLSGVSENRKAESQSFEAVLKSYREMIGRLEKSRDEIKEELTKGYQGVIETYVSAVADYKNMVFNLEKSRQDLIDRVQAGSLPAYQGVLTNRAEIEAGTLGNNGRQQAEEDADLANAPYSSLM